VNDHVRSSDLRRLLTREADPGKVRDIVDHLASCADCQRIAAELAGGSALVIADEDDFHPPEGDLTAYAQGKGSAADREIVATHIEDCALCRDAVDCAQPPPKHSDWRWMAAAAAMLFVIAGAFWTFVANRRTVHSPARPPRAQTSVPVLYPRTEWAEEVDRAIRSGALTIRGDLGQLHPDPRYVRGSEGDPSPAPMQPQGVVVRSARPTFAWPATAGASYVIAIRCLGSDTLIETPRLHDNTWTPSHALERGKTYQWQVSIERGDDIVTLPAPPAPLALFHVLEASLEQELTAAEKTHPADHVLLATLDARDGLLDDAAHELNELRQNPASASLARRLQASLHGKR